MGRILTLIILLIVYGSLYPWHFVPRELPQDPFLILLHSWHPVLTRFTIRDMIVNIALYVPFGMAGFLALRGPAQYWAVIGGGFILSCSIELIQLFEPARDSSAFDVATNLAGTAAGLVAGIIFERIAGPVRRDALKGRGSDRAALSLVFVWVAYLVFPFFPLVGTYGPGRKMLLFAHAPLFEPMVVLSGMAVWFAAGRLLRAAGIGGARWWLMTSIFAIPLQFFVVDRQPVPSDLLGAAAAIILFLWMGEAGKPRRPEAILFLLVILLRGLAPFQFSTGSQSFAWIPFGGFLATQWQSGILVMLEKGYYYGAAIWLLNASGVRFWRAAAVTAGVLLAIEVAQTRLPGRTPEITDPVLALLLAFGLRTVRRTQ